MNKFGDQPKEVGVPLHTDQRGGVYFSITVGAGGGGPIYRTDLQQSL